jgi:zinc protease
MLNLLEEGTTRRNSIQIAEAQERLGANIGAGQSLDRTASADGADAEPRAVARPARRRHPQPGLRPARGGAAAAQQLAQIASRS